MRGEEIPLLAQIMAVVDVYDAMTTQRPYQAAKPIDQAIEVIRQQVTRGWLGRDLVENFVAIIKSGRLDTYIRTTQLSDK